VAADSANKAGKNTGLTDSLENASTKDEGRRTKDEGRQGLGAEEGTQGPLQEALSRVARRWLRHPATSAVGR